MSARVMAKRLASFGIGQRGRMVHRAVALRVEFGDRPCRHWGSWERPTFRATWACGRDSTRPRLFHSPSGRGRCPKCFTEAATA